MLLLCDNHSALFCFDTHTGVESYHIDRAERIRSDNSIDHRNTDGTTQVHSHLLSPPFFSSPFYSTLSYTSVTLCSISTARCTVLHCTGLSVPYSHNACYFVQSSHQPILSLFLITINQSLPHHILLIPPLPYISPFRSQQAF
jgi:hypothetical protein